MTTRLLPLLLASSLLVSGAALAAEPQACPPCPCACAEDPPDTGELEGVDLEGSAALERAVMTQAPDLLDESRLALRRGDYAQAIELLQVLQDTPAWTRARPYWVEAVDGYVGSERERAGQLYQSARSAPRAQRRDALLEVRQILDDLLSDYPASAYMLPLQRNLERVERELEMLE